MLPDPISIRQVEAQKGAPPHEDVSALDPVHPRWNQRDKRVEDQKDQEGIEDGDPRWSKRELVLRRLDVPEPPPDLRLSADASDFRGQPADPFEVLIKRKEERRARARRGAPELAIHMRPGIPGLDEAVGDFEPRLYVVVGAGEPAWTLAHQIACSVARELPGVYLAYRQSARALTLAALARLAGDRAPGDLARARAVAAAFNPIRENLVVVEGAPEDTPGRLRARFRQQLARRHVRHGLIAVDDLVALGGEIRKTAGGRSPLLPDAALACAQDLARIAEQVGVPVLVVAPADLLGAGGTWPTALPEPVRLVLGDLPRGGGGPVEITVRRPQVGPLRPRGPAEAPVVALRYHPRHGFGPGPANANPRAD